MDVHPLNIAMEWHRSIAICFKKSSCPWCMGKAPVKPGRRLASGQQKSKNHSGSAGKMRLIPWWSPSVCNLHQRKFGLMSTTPSSSSPYHHHHHHHHHHIIIIIIKWAVGKWKNPGSVNSLVKTCENTLRRETVCFYRYVVAPGIARVGSVFPRVWASIRESCGQKVSRGALSEDEVGKMRTIL